MTQVRLAVKTGGSKIDVTTAVGSGIGTDAVRVLLDDANVTNKEQILLALEAIKQYIVQGKFPLA